MGERFKVKPDELRGYEQLVKEIRSADEWMSMLSGLHSTPLRQVVGPPSDHVHDDLPFFRASRYFRDLMRSPCGHSISDG